MAVDRTRQQMPTGRDREPDWPLIVCAVAAIQVGITVTHLVEDFVYGVPQSWGFSTLSGGAVFGLLYAIHALLIALAACGHGIGYLGNAMVGAGWAVAAILDHTDDILYADPYRQGLLSKAIEVGVIAGGLALFAIAYIAWERSRSRA
jgi:hypothetical protein